MTAADISTLISREDGETRGRYVAVIDGHEAELTYSKLGDSRNVIADHTGVPDELGGRGVASALVRYMVEDARSRGFRKKGGRTAVSCNWGRTAIYRWRQDSATPHESKLRGIGPSGFHQDNSRLSSGMRPVLTSM